MKNQLIGIAGVFAFTFFLFVLRYFYLSIGHHNRGRYVNPATPRRDHQSNTRSADDDAWLLRSTELDDQAGHPEPGFSEKSDKNRP